MTDDAIPASNPRQTGLIGRFLAFLAATNHSAWGYVAAGQHAAHHFGYAYTKVMTVQDWADGFLIEVFQPLRARLRAHRRAVRFGNMSDLDVMHLCHTLQLIRRGHEALNVNDELYPASQAAINNVSAATREDFLLVMEEYNLRAQRARAHGWDDQWDEVSAGVRARLGAGL